MYEYLLIICGLAVERNKHTSAMQFACMRTAKLVLTFHGTFVTEMIWGTSMEGVENRYKSWIKAGGRDKTCRLIWEKSYDDKI